MRWILDDVASNVSQVLGGGGHRCQRAALASGHQAGQRPSGGEVPGSARLGGPERIAPEANAAERDIDIDIERETLPRV